MKFKKEFKYLKFKKFKFLKITNNIMDHLSFFKLIDEFMLHLLLKKI